MSGPPCLLVPACSSKTPLSDSLIPHCSVSRESSVGLNSNYPGVFKTLQGPYGHEDLVLLPPTSQPCWVSTLAVRPGAHISEKKIHVVSLLPFLRPGCLGSIPPSTNLQLSGPHASVFVGHDYVPSCPPPPNKMHMLRSEP